MTGSRVGGWVGVGVGGGVGGDGQRSGIVEFCMTLFMNVPKLDIVLIITECYTFDFTEFYADT
jgi:hypothetical protein